jgi:hypothetical protein
VVVKNTTHSLYADDHVIFRNRKLSRLLGAVRALEKNNFVCTDYYYPRAARPYRRPKRSPRAPNVGEKIKFKKKYAKKTKDI